LPPAFTSQAQPEPKRVAAAWPNFSLKASKPPNVPVMAWATLPTGAPPPPGFISVQNSEWLAWPPPLLRTAVRMFFGNDGEVVGQQFADGLAGQFGRRFERLVQVRHVSVMVLAVVNLHGLLVDVWLERFGRVRQRWKREWHRLSISLSLRAEQIIGFRGLSSLVAG
jgi:hypothetical protein